jgi:hypothetical protein
MIAIGKQAGAPCELALCTILQSSMQAGAISEHPLDVNGDQMKWNTTQRTTSITHE